MDAASSLDRKNSERQMIEEGLCNEALGKLKLKGYGPAIVLSGEGWHEGVLGIVASRIAGMFYRPTVILSVNDGIARGSARSIPEFDMHSALTELSEMLLSFGGHRQAAGLRLRASELDSFEKRLAAAVEGQVSDLTPSLQIDAEVSLRDINFNLIRELEMLEPFGQGNPEPVFGSRGLEVINPMVVGKKHLKMKLKSRAHVMDAIWFNRGESHEAVDDMASVDAAYTATVNEWEGSSRLQLNLKALRDSNDHS
jgi:single-stranded-DNA-specific exonuclease